MLIDAIKLNDSDVEPLLKDLGKFGSFVGDIKLGGNNLTDQVIKYNII
jgi:hypothetical protein